MDGGTRQQAYDRGHTIFSPDGRLYQVEYAREAVERGSPAVGVRTGEGVVLAARKRLRSPLLEAESVAKIHRIDDHLAVASAGHAADARRLVESARVASQRHWLRYDEPMPAGSLTTTLADEVQERTQTGGARPYGAALLIGGVDAETASRDDGKMGDERGDEEAEDERYRLFEVDPSGTPYGWRATAIGSGSAGLCGYLEAELTGTARSAWTADHAAALALDALTSDDEPEAVPDALECWTLGPEPSIDRHSSTEIADLLASGAS